GGVWRAMGWVGATSAAESTGRSQPARATAATRPASGSRSGVRAISVRDWGMALLREGVGLGRADEVVLAQPAHVVRGVADHHAVVMDLEVRVVVLAVGDEGERVHERHGPVVVVEAEGPGDRLAVLDHLPARDLGQEFAQAC